MRGSACPIVCFEVVLRMGARFFSGVPSLPNKTLQSSRASMSPLVPSFASFIRARSPSLFATAYSLTSTLMLGMVVLSDHPRTVNSAQQFTLC
jgi:hypothetical protein